MVKKSCISVVAATLMIALTPSVAIGQTVVFDDAAAFAAAVGPTTVEDFNDANLATGLSIASSVGTISDGTFNDRLAAGGSTTFNFASGQTAFGGIFDLSAGGQGTGILVTFLTGGTQLAGELNSACIGCFFGFTSTEAFSSVTFNAGTQGGIAETYNLDNLQFAQVAAVPEPGTWAMMLIGFGAIGASMRRRRPAMLTQIA